MKPNGPIKVVSQLLDLPLEDVDGRWCGVVDDVVFSGGARNEARIDALLVGPGAYKGRLPGWMFAIVRAIAGDHVARVPLSKIDRIASAVHLNCAAEDLELHLVEDKVRRKIPRWGAM